MSAVALAPAPPRRRSALRRVARRPVAFVCLVVIGAFALLALLAPLLVQDPATQDYGALLAGPSGDHLLGTDDLGRDILARLLYGGRVSLVVGVASTALALTLALPLGLLAGYRRGWTDVAISRTTDLLLAFPYVITAIMLVTILGHTVATVVLALAVAQLPWLLRLIRGEVLSLRERDFVAAAVLDGAGDRTILFRYLVPNLSGVLVVQTSLMIPIAIIGEALLSFLGIGVAPPTPTWGAMLSSAQPFVERAPWLAIVPGATIALISLAFNLLGDSLRDELDPKVAE
ncbi:ABC transporter permease [Conexibacter woesei]|uniref:Binding-protein-dependent transport systems inner membrane component n=1 Tax=Conexibacter woesei (strain DSM 14684 / CCUG 47730 / CIP 108061 / JCM 11494 / NBRC 100937 / ID131577) TaxID=469383 RepID=D3FAQ5_CONWI|nr:ABC transporter permease [Conexibacter woesei]ADB51218.1 binding-protein-dependent transport systems inner membrane component [Conexibacter woesei DSM 14684]